MNSSHRVNISKAIQYILAEASDFVDYKLTICCGDPLVIIDKLQHHNRVAKEIELIGAQAQFIVQNMKEELTALGYDQIEENPNKWVINEKRIIKSKYDEKSTALSKLENAYDLLSAKNHQTHHEYEKLKSKHEEISITLSNLQKEFQKLSENNHTLFHEHEELKKNSASDLNTNIHHRALPQLATLKYLSKIIDILPTEEQVQKDANTKARRILSTVNSRADLRNDARHRFALNYTLYNNSNNLACTFIPKNGCSNLRYSLLLQMA